MSGSPSGCPEPQRGSVPKPNVVPRLRDYVGLAPKRRQPQRGCGHFRARVDHYLSIGFAHEIEWGTTPLGLKGRSCPPPKVGALRQPWALFQNAVGVPNCPSATECPNPSADLERPRAGSDRGRSPTAATLQSEVTAINLKTAVDGREKAQNEKDGSVGTHSVNVSVSAKLSFFCAFCAFSRLTAFSRVNFQATRPCSGRCGLGASARRAGPRSVPDRSNVAERGVGAQVPGD